MSEELDIQKLKEEAEEALDCTFIANAGPALTLALIERLEKAESLLEFARGLVKELLKIVGKEKDDEPQP